MKHGLRAAGLTELDDPQEYRQILERLTEDHDPDGEIECFLLESIALCMVRVRRARRMEAEYITEQLNAAIDTDSAGPSMEPVIDPARSAPLKKFMVEPLVGVYQRYQAAINIEMYRAMNQLERLQRIRRGENVPAPAAIDVSVHSRGQR
jgi:hypothetical protein